MLRDVSAGSVEEKTQEERDDWWFPFPSLIFLHDIKKKKGTDYKKKKGDLNTMLTISEFSQSHNCMRLSSILAL